MNAKQTIETCTGVYHKPSIKKKALAFNMSPTGCKLSYSRLSFSSQIADCQRAGSQRSVVKFDDELHW